MRVFRTTVAVSAVALLAAPAMASEGASRMRLMGKMAGQRSTLSLSASAAQLMTGGSQLDDQQVFFKELADGKTDGLLNDIFAGLNKDGVSDDEAEDIFTYFPYMMSAQSWKDFEASGSTDEAARKGAMQSAIKEMAGNMGKWMAAGAADAQEANVKSFLAEADSNAGLKDLFTQMQAGDPEAFDQIQQEFANRFFGGIDLMQVLDNSGLDLLRDNLFANEDLVRLVDNDAMMGILEHPEMRLKSTREMMETDLEGVLEELSSPFL